MSVAYTPEWATKPLMIDEDFSACGLDLVVIYLHPYQCQFCCRLCLQCNVRCRFFLPHANSVADITVALFTGCPFSVAVFTVIISATSLRAGAASELDGHPSLSSTYIYDAACSDVDVTDGDVALII